MKIGILTYHAVYNFGANLQALSTFSYLKKEGHEPIIIDFFPQHLEEAFDNTVPAKQANSHKSFVRKHFVLTNRCRNAENIASEIASNNIEAVIIGSDAVVQHYPILARIKIIPSRKRILIFRIDPIKYETNFPNPFWGEFIYHLDHKIKVAMMSVSCQNADYKLFTSRENRAINRMIEKFAYISVRDRRTQELFKNVSNGTCIPQVTPDPVFAFNDNIQNVTGKEDILRKFNLPEKYILLSFNSPKTVDQSWISHFAFIAKKTGLESVALAMPGGIIFPHNLRYVINVPLDPLDWYNIIKYSSAYIGEKMHPVIVSIHNNVPFFSFDHYGILKFKLFLNQKASKIYQILERAEFKEYRHSIAKRLNYKPPSPESVLEKITLFDKRKCTVFANQMSSEYQTMMKDLMQQLK